MKAPRKGSKWVFQACGWDIYDRRSYTPNDGDIVKVCQPYGCPKNGTMGMCYVETPKGEFIGMVAIGSLAPMKK